MLDPAYRKAVDSKTLIGISLLRAVLRGSDVDAFDDAAADLAFLAWGSGCFSLASPLFS